MREVRFHAQANSHGPSQEGDSVWMGGPAFAALSHLRQVHMLGEDVIHGGYACHIRLQAFHL